MTGYDYVKRLLEARAAAQLALAQAKIELRNLDILCTTMTELHVGDPDYTAEGLIEYFRNGAVDLTDSLLNTALLYSKEPKLEASNPCECCTKLDAETNLDEMDRICAKCNVYQAAVKDAQKKPEPHAACDGCEKSDCFHCPATNPNAGPNAGLIKKVDPDDCDDYTPVGPDKLSKLVERHADLNSCKSCVKYDTCEYIHKKGND